MYIVKLDWWDDTTIVPSRSDEFHFFYDIEDALNFGHDVAYGWTTWREWDCPKNAYLFRAENGVWSEETAQFLCNWPHMDQNVKG